MNLKIEGTANNVGLFGYINNATLRNIRLASGTVNGTNYVGGICGVAVGNTFITNTHSSVVVTGSIQIGGICGYANGIVTITSCRNTGNVKGTGGSTSILSSIGGIIGQSDGPISKIKDCDNRGEVEGYHAIGGIMGYSYSLTIEITACRNSGSIKNTGFEAAGGIVGANNTDKTLTVTACYNIGTVNHGGGDNRYTGGVIGYNNRGATLIACYNTGTVTGSNANLVGLICGNNVATIASSYWTKGSSTATKGVANGTDTTKEFSATAWPTSSESGWGIGNDSGANRYWKSLGGWNGGAPEYPRLWWE
jgi:hypothetical protein